MPGEMDSWWDRNGASLRRYDMVFRDHACITTLGDNPGDSATLQERRASSRGAVHDLISRNCLAHDPPTSRPPRGRDSGNKRNPAAFLLSIMSRRP
ncbi:hypothetical protein ID866_7404 [Astraeus odoratus]|nr:hypothetical protein ID866_7404 [Astraeus odoratus]